MNIENSRNHCRFGAEGAGAPEGAVPVGVAEGAGSAREDVGLQPAGADHGRGGAKTPVPQQVPRS